MYDFHYKDKDAKEQLHPQDKKVLIIGGSTAAAIVVIGISIMCYVRWGMPAPAALPVSESSSITQASSSTVLELPEYDTNKETNTANSNTATQDKLVETTDENGDYLKTQEIGKPQEPEKPVIEDESALTNPDTPPTYTEPPTANNGTPQPGDVNAAGETYIPGVGWIGEGSGGVGEYVPGEAGTGAIIGQ